MDILQMEQQSIILLFDGTWCGRETSTQTNVYRLAKMVWWNVDLPPTDTDEHVNPQDNARYIHGVGLGSTFME
jgi:hypothetical protein